MARQMARSPSSACRASPGRLTQVLVNLLLNAADAVSGQGEIRVSARREGDAVVVEVDDVGMLWVVGALTTRVPEELVLKARRVVVEGEDEVLVRSGTAAMVSPATGSVGRSFKLWTARSIRSSSSAR